jgi:guanylate kinase
MIVLVGESASGKSTIQNVLVSRYGYKKYPSYTTRPQREGEINGKDYYFVSDEQFVKKDEHAGFIETAQYYKWYYGTPIEAFQEDAVLVLTPKGFRQVKKLVDEIQDNLVSLHSFYICVPRRDRLIKMLSRKEQGGREDDIEEAYRRNVSDIGMFDGVSDEVDHIVCNPEYKDPPIEMASRILDLIGD